ncbi:hypothetical protein SASC598J21_002140 [Snodgrassella alvi SCGC AB-598-J21]|uniref:Uncharacterized protein n=1 Tax=Snodgrassella alvi SCGC AB-598-J21 TaxID=1385367 RepID=A0A074VA42_9NEIS|nr:hypothetical protein SASC598J21_002140 [Snodgrassella alvi SCGC AB-598-J21]
MNVKFSSGYLADRQAATVQPDKTFSKDIRGCTFREIKPDSTIIRGVFNRYFFNRYFLNIKTKSYYNFIDDIF